MATRMWIALLLDVALHSVSSLHIAESRELQGLPVVTGCVEECGSQDQQCITDCHVCVERAHCHNVQHNCTGCLDGVHAARSSAVKEDNYVDDSGGAPLAYQGLAEQLDLARHLQIRVNRRLRLVRQKVISATREVDYAGMEKREETNELKNATAALKQARKNEDQQDLDSERRVLKHHRATARAAHERRRAEAESSKDLDPVARSEALDRQQEAEEAEEAAEKAEENAKWVDKQQHREREIVSDSVEQDLEDLKMARQLEKLSENSLEKSKDEYYHEAARKTRVDAKVRELEIKTSPENNNRTLSEQSQSDEKAEEAAEKEAEKKAEEADETIPQEKGEEAVEKEAEKKAEEADEKEAEKKAEEADEKEAEKKAEEADEKDPKEKAEEAVEKEPEEKAEEAVEKDPEKKAEEAAEKEPETKVEEAAGRKSKEEAEEKAAEKQSKENASDDSEDGNTAKEDPDHQSDSWRYHPSFVWVVAFGVVNAMH